MATFVTWCILPLLTFFLCGDLGCPFLTNQRGSILGNLELNYWSKKIFMFHDASGRVFVIKMIQSSSGVQNRRVFVRRHHQKKDMGGTSLRSLFLLTLWDFLEIWLIWLLVWLLEKQIYILYGIYILIKIRKRERNTHRENREIKKQNETTTQTSYYFISYPILFLYFSISSCICCVIVIVIVLSLTDFSLLLASNYICFFATNY
jgi:hypothetical protein